MGLGDLGEDRGADVSCVREDEDKKARLGFKKKKEGTTWASLAHERIG